MTGGVDGVMQAKVPLIAVPIMRRDFDTPHASRARQVLARAAIYVPEALWIFNVRLSARMCAKQGAIGLRLRCWDGQDGDLSHVFGQRESIQHAAPVELGGTRAIHH